MNENPKLRVLTEDEYLKALSSVMNNTGRLGKMVTFRAAEAIADGVLLAVGVIWPAPEPESETCPSLYATRDGWLQCEDEPGHDGDDHEGGDWGWSDTDPNAIPPVKEN